MTCIEATNLQLTIRTYSAVSLASQPELALIDDLVIKNEPTQAELLAMVQDLAGINILQPAADIAFDNDYGIIPPEQLIVVRPYGDDADDMLLAELRPRWVIMYDPNQDFLRRIEVSVGTTFLYFLRWCLFMCRYIARCILASHFESTS